MSERILIGEITTAHGIKGFVKVRCFADDTGLLESGPLFLSPEGNDTLTLTIRQTTDKGFIAQVDGVKDRNEAEGMRGTKLYVERALLPEPEDGEYYYEDLKGMKVVDAAGAAIGTVLSVANFGAGDLLDIQKAGSAESFYLPFTAETVPDVNLADKIITAQIPEDWL